jgi:hypothetical protein
MFERHAATAPSPTGPVSRGPESTTPLPEPELVELPLLDVELPELVLLEAELPELAPPDDPSSAGPSASPESSAGAPLLPLLLLA